MNLWSWYAHSWYPGCWEIGFDLRRWMLGIRWRHRELAIYVGPMIFCYDKSLCPF